MVPILYYWTPSPPARACMMVIRYLDLDVEIHKKSFDVIKDPEYEKKNPDRKIPILEEDEFFLPESVAICRYLIESKAPERADELLGETPKERSIINHRLDYNTGTMFPKMLNAFLPIVFGGNDSIPQKQKDEIFKALETLDSLLSEYPYAAGEHVTLADLVFLPVIASLKALIGDLSKYPAIDEWYNKLSTVPGFEECDEGGKFHANLIQGMLKDPF